ncbi:ArnT family glycosyltransferase [Mesorhizobium atlanticum]
MNRNYLFLFLFSIVMTFAGLASLPPVDRDESRFVQATKQMVETGDYVDIRLQDVTRYKKPIGIYWLQSAAVALSGEGPRRRSGSICLVSMLGIAIAVVGIGWTGTKLFGANAGLAAGLMMAAIFATAFEGRDAKTDAMLLACCVIAQGALAQVYLAAKRNEPVPGHLPWIFWIAQGLGILIKGPVSPLLSLLTAAVLFAFDRDWRWLTKMKLARGVAMVLLIVLPWLVLITWKSGGAFFQEAVGKDMLNKVAQGEESHGLPPGFYMLTYSLFMWPFGLIAVGAGLQAINRFWDDPRLRFCLAWYIPFWLLFEAIPTKLPHYVMPAYPGMALLIGWLLTLPADQAQRATEALADMAVVGDRLRPCRGGDQPCRSLRRRAALSCPDLLLVEHTGGGFRSRHRLSCFPAAIAGAASAHRRNRGRRRNHLQPAVRRHRAVAEADLA